MRLLGFFKLKPYLLLLIIITNKLTLVIIYLIITNNKHPVAQLSTNASLADEHVSRFMNRHRMRS